MYNKYPVSYINSYTGVIVAGQRKFSLPPLEVLRYMFTYDSETGVLTRYRYADGRLLKHPKPVGSADAEGYLVASIGDSAGNRRMYKVHQLVWYMFHGTAACGMLDHINGRRYDNAIANLREADSVTQGRNGRKRKTNTSGVTGVHWDKKANAWRAEARGRNSKKVCAGYFYDLTEAAEAVTNLRRELGVYTNEHGKSPGIGNTIQQ